MSKKVTVSADGTSATVTDATIGDVFSTLLSTDAAVTGTYALLQRGGLLLAGMSVQQYRKSGTFNPF